MFVLYAHPPLSLLPIRSGPRFSALVYRTQRSSQYVIRLTYWLALDGWATYSRRLAMWPELTLGHAAAGRLQVEGVLCFVVDRAILRVEHYHKQPERYCDV